MQDLTEKCSIITGASSGIGKYTSILFYQLGSDLAIVGRDESALDETIKECLSLKNKISINDFDILKV